MIWCLAWRGSDGADELQSYPAQAIAEGPLMASHSVDASLRWALPGVGGLEENEEKTSGVLKVLEAGLVPTAELAMEESIGQAEG
ncbi:hypothetical protein B296_00009989 [Ensete ventricosum]|uniref:Uncharacterized protein n=1 Tax=Ensete ventricosum TaxID=4639 RepID=A0A427AQI3_ENSVE|nr:hypothetical protein B296_00009989 [Ensete ventricosum]